MPGFPSKEKMNIEIDDKIKESKISRLFFFDSIAAIVVLGIVLRLIIVKFVPDQWEDSYNYILNAERSCREGWAGFWFGKTQHLAYVGLYHGLNKLAGNAPFLVGKAISLFWSVAVIVLMACILSRHHSRQAALWGSGILSVVAVPFAMFSMAVLSEPMFTALVLLAFMFCIERKGWLLGVVTALLFVTRHEALLAAFAFGFILLFEKKWRILAQYLTITVPVMVLWKIFLLSGTDPQSIQDSFEFRYGGRGGPGEILLFAVEGIERIKQILVGYSAILMLLMTLITLAGALLLFRSREEVKKRNQAVYKAAFLFFMINLSILVLMKYLRLHPFNSRHLIYIVPSFVILFSISLTEIIHYCSNKSRNIKTRRLLQCAAVILLLLFHAAAFFSPQPGQGWINRKKGTWMVFKNMTVSSRAKGEWLKKQMRPDDRALTPLPSLCYFAGLTFERVDQVWPPNPLDYKWYKSRNIRWVAWTNLITDTQGLPALKRGQDYFFFHHHWTPPRIGWYPIVYEIVPYYNMDAALGIIQFDSSWDLDANNNRSFSGEAGIRIAADAVSYRQLVLKGVRMDTPGTLSIFREDREIARYDFSSTQSLSTGRDISLFVSINPNENLFVLKATPQTSSSLAPTVSLSRVELLLQDQGLFQVSHDEDTWWEKEKAGRWMKQRSILNIHNDKDRWVWIQVTTKSFHIDRQLHVSLNERRMKTLDGPAEKTFVLDGIFFLPEGDNNLVFFTPQQGTVPLEVGRWEDKRCVTFFVNKLYIQPLDFDEGLELPGLVEDFKQIF